MTQVKQFWLVWNPDGLSPIVKYQTEESAYSGAERLATINMGQEFYVLACVGGRSMDSMKKIEILKKESHSELDELRRQLYLTT